MLQILALQEAYDGLCIKGETTAVPYFLMKYTDDAVQLAPLAEWRAFFPGSQKVGGTFFFLFQAALLCINFACNNSFIIKIMAHCRKISRLVISFGLQLKVNRGESLSQNYTYPDNEWCDHYTQHPLRFFAYLLSLYCLGNDANNMLTFLTVMQM